MEGATLTKLGMNENDSFIRPREAGYEQGRAEKWPIKIFPLG